MEAGFTTGQVKTDGAALLLRETDCIKGLVKRLLACFTDGRDAERIEHTLEEMRAQPNYGLALD